MRTPTDRLVARTVRVTPRRPSPPRELIFESSTNILTWQPPLNTRGVTHYRVRLNSDGDAPTFQPPVGQTTLQLTPGVTRVFVSSYNDVSELESQFAMLDIAPSGSGGSSGPLVLTFSGSQATKDLAYRGSLVASGGSQPYVFSLASGSLPAGLTLNADTGLISGNPTTIGTTAFVGKVTDADGSTQTVSCSITVSGAVSATALRLTFSGAQAVKGSAYNGALTATGGVLPYTFSITTGALPTGLTLSATSGSITGTPTTVQFSPFTAKVTDSAGAIVTLDCAIEVLQSVQTLRVTWSGAQGQRGAHFYGALTGSGGVLPYTFSLLVGTLPTGITLDAPSGSVFGTPTVAGQSNVIFQITDAIGTTATATAYFNIAEVDGSTVLLPVASCGGRDLGHGTDDFIDSDNRLVYFRVGASALFSTNPLELVTWYLSKDNGATFYWVGSWLFISSGQEINFPVVRPTTTQTWKVAAVAGKVQGDAALPLIPGALPSGAQISAGFTVAGLALPTAVDPNPTYPAGDGSNFPYNRKTPDGAQYWSVPACDVDLSAVAAVKDAAFLNVTYVDLDAAGREIGPEHIRGSYPVVNGHVAVANVDGEYGTTGDTYTRQYPYPSGTPTNIAGIRSKFYLSNNVDQTTGAWSNTGASVLVATRDITVAVGGAIPDGAILTTRFDPSTLDPSLTKDPTTRNLKVNTGSFANLVLNGNFENGAVGWTLPTGQAFLITDPAGAFSSPNFVRFYTIHWDSISSTAFSVRPGDVIYMEAWARAVALAPSTAPLSAYVAFYDGSGGYLGATSYALLPPTTGSYTRIYTSGAAPTGAATAKVIFEYRSNTPDPNVGFYQIDSVLARYSVGPLLDLMPSNPIALNVANQLGILNNSVGNAYFLDGSIGGDLGKWATHRIPYGFYYGFPSVSDPNVPDVIIDTSQTPYRVYNRVGGAWVSQKTQPGDMVAGVITALVQLNAARIQSVAGNGMLYINEIAGAPYWNPANFYGTTNTWVYYNDTLWRCTIANSGQVPFAGSAYWAQDTSTKFPGITYVNPTAGYVVTIGTNGIQVTSTTSLAMTAINPGQVTLLSASGAGRIITTTPGS